MATRLWMPPVIPRSEEHTSELQSLRHLVCRLLLEKKQEGWSAILGSGRVLRGGGGRGWRRRDAGPEGRPAPYRAPQRDGRSAILSSDLFFKRGGGRSSIPIPPRGPPLT